MSFWKRKQQSSTGAPLARNLGDARLRFEVIVNSIEDGVILIDNQQTIQLYNPGASSISGWPVDEATGINVQTVLPLLDDKGQPVKGPDNPFNKVFETDQTLHENKATLLTRNKMQLGISLNLTPLFDENKHVTAAIAVFRNVSQERAEEQQRGDFISTASHEMRYRGLSIFGVERQSFNN
jgi:PAS domain S-box-containing protein